MAKIVEWPVLKQAEQMLGEARLSMGLEDFPFKSRLSMEPLVKFWRSKLEANHPQNRLIASEISQYVTKHPSLLDPYEDVQTFLSEHSEVITLLLSGIFPAVLSKKLIGYASAPFGIAPFYTTESMQLLLSDPNSSIEFQQFGEFDKIPYSIRACLIILKKHYGVKLETVLPFLFRVKYEDTNKEMFYKTNSMLDYLQVKVKGTPPKISPEKLNYLLNNSKDVSLWLDTFSPNVFHFEGLFIAFMNDVTEVETLSQLRRILLAPGALLNNETARTIANLTRIYLQVENVEVGISALDYPTERSVAHRYKINYPIVKDEHPFVGSLVRTSPYEQACRQNKTEIISDLRKIENPTPIEQALVNNGYRSLMIVPLRDQVKQVIGMMELASSEPFAFNYLKKLKLKEILPLYDIALEESRKSVENRIQNIIQEQYTNIHPSVLWKFTETAFDFIEEKENKGDMASLRPIIFRGVHPFYGQIDIINSTKIRNKAVRTDMKKNLVLLYEVLERVHQYFGYPILQKHLFQLKAYLEAVEGEFNNSLEASVADVLREEIHPLLKDLGKKNLAIAELVQGYMDKIDHDLQIVYQARKDYQDSINALNRTISNHLDKQEIINQQIIPHYFEKYKTDGVEYTMYLGQSLLQHDQFTIHHLHNLRLWQLKSMIEIHERIKSVQESLPLHLPMSYLILVYSSSLSIKFRLDEKHFDIDGAYHLQYEVIKNRIDKATIADSKERLRKADTISIAYLQEKEKKEYLGYLNYLINEGLLKDHVEDLEIKPLQGVQGLRALRVAFNH
ncbi:MAG: GAF domain-containing protein [Saprospiraceae bacterium]|nr:GAF domain-containing protein [Saprospiraceae bacterium]